jgi:hypothetical protein
MNRYVGLEQYATWDICGVARGTIVKGEKVPKETARTWICDHLDTAVSNADFFTEKVFTKEVLEKINTHIQPIFNYSDMVQDINVDEILEEAE